MVATDSLPVVAVFIALVAPGLDALASSRSRLPRSMPTMMAAPTIAVLPFTMLGSENGLPPLRQALRRKSGQSSRGRTEGSTS